NLDLDVLPLAEALLRGRLQRGLDGADDLGLVDPLLPPDLVDDRNQLSIHSPGPGFGDTVAITHARSEGHVEPGFDDLPPPHRHGLLPVGPTERQGHARLAGFLQPAGEPPLALDGLATPPDAPLPRGP